MQLFANVVFQFRDVALHEFLVQASLVARGGTPDGEIEAKLGNGGIILHSERCTVIGRLEPAERAAGVRSILPERKVGTCQNRRTSTPISDEQAALFISLAKFGDVEGLVFKLIDARLEDALEVL